MFNYGDNKNNFNNMWLRNETYVVQLKIIFISSYEEFSINKSMIYFNRHKAKIKIKK